MRNGGRTLDDALEAFYACETYDHPWEVVVADNGSTDDTCEVCAAWAKRLPAFRARGCSPIVRAPVMLATSGRRPLRVNCSHSCDVDDVADEHWLDALVEAARAMISSEVSRTSVS